MKKINKILLELSPLAVLLILLTFIRQEIAIAFLALLGLILTFTINYEKREVYFFLFGAVIGIIFEFIGNSLLGQTWSNASFFGIPVWLPLTWGYGFILIRRIGNIILK